MILLTIKKRRQFQMILLTIEMILLTIAMILLTTDDSVGYWRKKNAQRHQQWKVAMVQRQTCEEWTTSPFSMIICKLRMKFQMAEHKMCQIRPREEPWLHTRSLRTFYRWQTCVFIMYLDSGVSGVFGVFGVSVNSYLWPIQKRLIIPFLLMMCTVIWQFAWL